MSRSDTADLRQLTRRERQIMDVLFAAGEATAAEVQAQLPDPPSYSAVRALLGKLEDKGHVAHHEQGPRYVYTPTLSPAAAQGSALERLVTTFFDGSVARAVNGLLGMSAERLPAEELDELAAIIEAARKRGQ